jgi:hypothetical protein
LLDAEEVEGGGSSGIEMVEHQEEANAPLACHHCPDKQQKVVLEFRPFLDERGVALEVVFEEDAYLSDLSRVELPLFGVAVIMEILRVEVGQEGHQFLIVVEHIFGEGLGVEEAEDLGDGVEVAIVEGDQGLEGYNYLEQWLAEILLEPEDSVEEVDQLVGDLDVLGLLQQRQHLVDLLVDADVRVFLDQLHCLAQDLHQGVNSRVVFLPSPPAPLHRLPQPHRHLPYDQHRFSSRLLLVLQHEFSQVLTEEVQFGVGLMVPLEGVLDGCEEGTQDEEGVVLDEAGQSAQRPFLADLPALVAVADEVVKDAVTLVVGKCLGGVAAK